MRKRERKNTPASPHPRTPARISVVIPALNEAGYIGRTLCSVEKQRGPKEAVVVDGGSTDGTPARAAAAGARVIAAARGRADQMNAGAARTHGSVLLFLHADTTLPEGALAAVRRALSDRQTDAGTFRLRFNRQTPLLRLYGLATRIRWRRFCYGDRGLFVRRRVFEAVGGYPDWPIFEDLELAGRLHRGGRFRYLPLEVTTAARRFERNGPLRQQLHNFLLWSRYLLGADPQAAACRYRYGE